MAYEFARRMGRYAPRTMYCELFLDGDYLGVYNLTEKIKRDGNRVDIAKLNPQDTVGEELTGGYIIEMNHNGAPGAWDSQFLPINYNTCNLPVQFKLVEPRQDEIQAQQASYIKAYTDSFELSLHLPNYADPDTGYRKWIDESSFIDFMFVNEFSTNYDSYGRSTFMYKEKETDGGKLKIGPAWDYDRGYCCEEGWVWEITHDGWPFPDWWSILHNDSIFLQQRYCRWQELREGAWQTTEFLDLLDSLQALLAAPAARNFERWPELNYADFDGNIAQRKINISNRLAWMDAQIMGSSCEVSAVNEETAEDWVELSPNPTESIVRISLAPHSHSAFIRVTDISGNHLITTEIPTGQTSAVLEVENWAPGIYFTQLIHEKGKWCMKLVVL